VKRASDELLAGAALAGDEDGGVGVGDAADHRRHLANRRARADDRRNRRRDIHRRAQATDFAVDREVIERALQRDDERVELHRLGQIVVGARPHRFDRGVVGTHARQHDGEQVGVAHAQLVAELDARQPRHLDVRDDDIDIVVPHPFEALGGGGDRMTRDLSARQTFAQQLTRIFIIIDEEDRRHVSPALQGTRHSAHGDKYADQLDRDARKRTRSGARPRTV